MTKNSAQHTDTLGGVAAETLGEAAADASADTLSELQLWRGDTGELSEALRRALLELIKGPYLSGQRSPVLWSAVLANERLLRSRLHELFLELVIDRDHEFACVRNVSGADFDAPKTVRSVPLTFFETAMLLVLRQYLLGQDSDARVIVSQHDVFEQLSVYRTDSSDDAAFQKRLNAAWQTMKAKIRVIHPLNEDTSQGGEVRAEISPVLRLLLRAEEVSAIQEHYQLNSPAGQQSLRSDNTPSIETKAE